MILIRERMLQNEPYFLKMYKRMIKLVNIQYCFGLQNAIIKRYKVL